MKYKLTAAEHQALPADRQSEYAAQADGSYQLKLDGVDVGALQAKVDEFRTTNINVLRERDALQTKVTELATALKPFEGIEPATAKAAIAKVAELAGTGITKPDDIQARIDAAVKAVVEPLNAKLGELTEREKAAQAQAQSAMFQTRFDDVALGVGVRKSALPDVRRRAADAGFKLVGDQVKAVNAEGATVYRDGAELTPDRWLREVLQREADYMFETTTGGGAPGSRSPGAAPGQTLVNPTPVDFGKNLADIAAGKIGVEMTPQTGSKQ